jgi:hypothetical protein
MKAKRKLSNFDFSKKGCHISLVGESLGGPANGVTTLLLKSLNPVGDINKTPEGEGNNMEMVEKSAVEGMVKKAVDEAVAVYKSKVEALEAEKAAVIEKARKAKLEEIIGTAELESTFKAVKDLAEDAFEIVLKGFKTAKDSEEKAFKAVGADGAKADASKTIEKSSVMQALEQKYQAK